MDILCFHVLRNDVLTLVLKWLRRTRRGFDTVGLKKGHIWVFTFSGLNRAEVAGIPSSAWLKENSVLCIAAVTLQFSHQNHFNSRFLPSAALTQPLLPSRRHFYKPECVLSVYWAYINPAGRWSRKYLWKQAVSAAPCCCSGWSGRSSASCPFWQASGNLAVSPSAAGWWGGHCC